MSIDDILKKAETATQLQKSAREKEDWDLTRKLEFNRRLENRLFREIDKYASTTDLNDTESCAAG